MKRERKEVAENGQCFSGQAASLPPIRRQFILRWNGVSEPSQDHRNHRGHRPRSPYNSLCLLCPLGPPQESTSDSGSTQAAQSQRQLGVRRTSGTARHRARHVQSDCRPVEQSGLYRGSRLNRRRLPVPNSLQYPLERERELQHRWNRLLQRSVAPKDHSSRSPLSSVVRSNLRNSPRPAATTHRPPLRA